MRYIDFYRKLAIKRSVDFSNPKALPDKMVLPNNSVLLYLDKGLSSSSYFIKDNKDIGVYLARGYYTKGLSMGSYVKKSVSFNKLMNGKTRVDRGMRFVTSIDIFKRLVSKNTGRGIVDYSYLDNVYKYKNSVTSNFSMMNNVLNTVVNEVEDKRYGESHYILPIGVPSNLPNKSLMEKMYTKFHRYSSSMDLFIWIEIFKLIDGKEREGSIFFKEGEGAVNLDLVIHGMDKYVLLNLKTIVDLGYGNSARVKLLKLLIPMMVGVGEVDIKNMSDEDIEKLTVSKYNDLSVDNEERVVSKVLEKEEIKDDIDTLETVQDINIDVLKGIGIIDDKWVSDNKELIDSNAKKLKELENRDMGYKPRVVKAGNNILQESMLTDTVIAQHKNYMKEHYSKDIEMAIYSLSSAGVLVKDIEVIESSDMANRTEKYKITLKLPHGGRKVVNMSLPKPDENGVFLNSGNEYVMSKQKVDVPIKKIDVDSVVLMSFYGKLFINRAGVGRDNKSKFLVREINKLILSPDSKLTMLNAGQATVSSTDLPEIYMMFSKEILGIKFDGITYSFSYNSYHVKEVKDIKFKLSSGEVIVGRQKNKVFTIIKSGELITYTNGKESKREDFLTKLGVDKENMPIEYASIMVVGSKLPVILPLLHWRPFKYLIKDYKVKIVESKKDIEDGYEYIKFKDGFLTFSKTDLKTALTVGGLKTMEKHLKFYNINDLNDIDVIKDLLSTFANVVKLDGELRSLHMFIDPMTKRVLKKMGEPTILHKLVVRAVELLETSYLKDPYDVEEFLIKGYERVSGMVYNSLARSMRSYNKDIKFSRNKFELNPFETYTNVSSDPTYSLIEDLNPLEYQKQLLEVKSIGMFGRSKDAVKTQDRVYHINDVGTFSEAGKDDSNVGSTLFLSEAAKLKDTLGRPSSINKDELNPNMVFSPSAMLLPSSNRDDGKRMLYSSIMDKHIVFMVNSVVTPFRTGYESILPYRIGDRFCVNSSGDGIVSKIEDGDKIEIKFGKEKKVFSLAKTESRVVGGKHYTFVTKTLLKVGDKVTDGDNITYNSAYFGKDILNPKRVAYKGGVMANVLLEEGHDSFEDSSKVCEHFSKELATKVTYEVSNIYDGSDALYYLVSVGENVQMGDNLLTYGLDVGDVGDSDTSTLLAELNKSNLKTESKGEVIKVDIFYNGDIKTFSKSMRKLIKTVEGENVGSRRVELGYSVKGRQLMNGEVAIKINIEKTLNLGIIDKYIIGNQLKTTNAVIEPTFKTESGRVMDVTYGKLSVDARKVQAVYGQGLVNMIMEKLEEDVIKLIK